jgi:hypothetical protein
MKRFKLPATLRWAVINCLLIWLTMSLYRGFLLALFLKGNPSEFLALLSGMPADAGVMALILIFYILISFFPALHPFKSKRGKFFGYFYFIFSGMLIAIAYALDLIFVKVIHYRMYGSKVLEIFENPNETEVFFKNVTLTPLILIIGLLLWIWAIIIVKLHGYISHLSRVQSKTKRITWQAWTIAVCILLAGFALIQGNALTPSNLNMKAAPYYALRSNPVLSFLLI